MCAWTAFKSENRHKNQERNWRILLIKSAPKTQKYVSHWIETFNQSHEVFKKIRGFRNKNDARKFGQESLESDRTSLLP